MDVLPVDRIFVLELSGADAGKHVQRFCTADVLSLADGAGTEAMFLNVKGKLLAWGEVYRCGESWFVCGLENQGARLQQHLDRYVIREDVKFAERTGELSAFVVPVESAAPWGVRMVREDRALRLTSRAWGAGWELRLVPRGAETPAELEALRSGVSAADGERLETRRIERRYPRFGIDISEDSLPQELDRDAQAICFTKGCYLGQETVARIDALGHVNRKLVTLAGQGEKPACGSELKAGDAAVGSISSVAATSEGWVALATVKRSFAKIGSVLTTVVGSEAHVVAGVLD